MKKGTYLVGYIAGVIAALAAIEITSNLPVDNTVALLLACSACSTVCYWLGERAAKKLTE